MLTLVIGEMALFVAPHVSLVAFMRFYQLSFPGHALISMKKHMVKKSI